MNDQEKTDFIIAMSRATQSGLITFEEYLISSQTFELPKRIRNKTQAKTMEGNKLEVNIITYSSSYGNSRSYIYTINGERAMTLNQIPYPECCGIAIFKDVSVGEISKDNFIKAINEIKDDLRNNDEFSKVLFYTNTRHSSVDLFSSYPNITILDQFRNKRSGNMLIGFEIDLLKDDIYSWQKLDISEGDVDFEEVDGEDHDEIEDVSMPMAVRPTIFTNGLSGEIQYQSPNPYSWSSVQNNNTTTQRGFGGLLNNGF